MKTKLISITLVLISLFTLLCSCGGETAYKTDVPLSQLQSAAEAVLSNTDTLATLDSDYIEYMMELEASSFAEAIVRQQASGISADEYGIFKAASNEEAAALGAMLEAYLTKRDETWNPSYDADQYPKIKNATVKVFGQYAVFCILSDTDRDAVYSAVENILLGK